MLNTVLNGKTISVNASVDMTLLFVFDNDVGMNSTVSDVGRARARRKPFVLDRGLGRK
jgi:hypothetical protein